MDTTPDKETFNLKQWLKDYGVLAAIISAALFLGIPGLYRLGAMSEQLRHLDATIREDIKPELRTLREEAKLIREQFAEVRTEVKLLREQFTEVRAKVATVEQIVVRIEAKMGDLAKDLQKSP